MSHFYVAFYFISLFSGALLLANMFPRYKQSLAFVEILAIYITLTVFVVAGTATIYAGANLTDAVLAKQLFACVTSCILGILIYLLPRYHHIHTRLPFSRPIHTLFIGLAMLGPGAAIALWIVPTTQHLSVMLVPIAGLFMVIFYGQIVNFRYSKDKPSSHAAKLAGVIVPLLPASFAMLEVFLFNEVTIQYGVTLSLPLIYLLSNISAWVFRERLFPAHHYSGSELHYPDSLSKKEREIAKEIYLGYSNKQIAGHMGISDSTVKNHLYNIYKKTGVTSRTALIRLLMVQA